MVCLISHIGISYITASSVFGIKALYMKVNFSQRNIAIVKHCSTTFDIMKLLICSLIIVASLLSTVNAEVEDGPVETVNVNEGDPFILNFGYSGPTLDVSADLTKDGVPFDADNIRTFKQLGRLFFSEVLDHDAGEYHLSIHGNGIHFTKTIKLSG